LYIGSLHTPPPGFIGISTKFEATPDTMATTETLQPTPTLAGIVTSIWSKPGYPEDPA
jgi:hypothetical protein